MSRETFKRETAARLIAVCCSDVQRYDYKTQKKTVPCSFRRDLGAETHYWSRRKNDRDAVWQAIRDHVRRECPGHVVEVIECSAIVVAGSERAIEEHAGDVGRDNSSSDPGLPSQVRSSGAESQAAKISAARKSKRRSLLGIASGAGVAWDVKLPAARP